MIKIGIIIAILIFGILILVHEAGHFAAARICGVGIHEFAVGMGPTVLSHKAKSGTVFSLRILPVGGFVSMVGEDPEEEQTPDSLLSKTKLQRLFIFSAGALTNILVGFAAMFIFCATQPVYPSTVIYSVEESVLAEYGVMQGDKIVAINGKRINIASDISDVVMIDGAKPMDITFSRNGEDFTAEGIRFPTVTSEGIEVGVTDFALYGIERSFTELIRQTFYGAFGAIKLVFTSLGMLLGGEYGMEAVSGPVGTVEAVAQAASMGWRVLLYFFIVISMNLGVMNLLPFPALDGGHIAFLAVEAVIGKPVNRKVQGIISAVGFTLLMLLIVFITYKDIMKILF